MYKVYLTKGGGREIHKNKQTNKQVRQCQIEEESEVKVIVVTQRKREKERKSERASEQENNVE